MKTLRAIVIDTNSSSRERLCKLIGSFELDVEVVACFADAKKALKELDELNPELLFIDFECCTKPFMEQMVMRDLLRMEVIILLELEQKSVLKTSNIKALMVIKPYKDQQVHKVIRVAMQSFVRHGAAQKPEAELNKLNKEPTLIIEEGRKKRVIKVRDVIYCKSCNNSLTFYFEHQVQWSLKVEEGTGFSIVSSRSFAEWEEELERKGIIRCHRSYGINKEYINGLEGGAEPLVNLGSKTTVPVSKSYLAIIERLLREG